MVRQKFGVMVVLCGIGLLSSACSAIALQEDRPESHPSPHISGDPVGKVKHQKIVESLP